MHGVRFPILIVIYCFIWDIHSTRTHARAVYTK